VCTCTHDSDSNICYHNLSHQHVQFFSQEINHYLRSLYRNKRVTLKKQAMLHVSPMQTWKIIQKESSIELTQTSTVLQLQFSC